jgi:hypothetical protein
LILLPSPVTSWRFTDFSTKCKVAKQDTARSRRIIGFATCPLFLGLLTVCVGSFFNPEDGGDMFP